ncbi:MAG: flagellar hook-length control protein FliK [Desulfobacteraceae bacterium]|nr:flagellar hook-length control protein FliK [Desulfobacteraceae bacterium]
MVRKLKKKLYAVDIQSVIKAVLEPLEDRAKGTLPGLAVGDRLDAKVLRTQSGQRVLIDLGRGYRASAQTSLPVKSGQQLQLQVVETGNLLHLRVISEEPAFTQRPIPMFSPAHLFSGRELQQLKTSIDNLAANLQIPDTVRQALVQMRALFEPMQLNRPASQVAADLRAIVEDSGMFLEKKILDAVLTSGERSQQPHTSGNGSKAVQVTEKNLVLPEKQVSPLEPFASAASGKGGMADQTRMDPNQPVKSQVSYPDGIKADPGTASQAGSNTSKPLVSIPETLTSDKSEHVASQMKEIGRESEGNVLPKAREAIDTASRIDSGDRLRPVIKQSIDYTVLKNDEKQTQHQAALKDAGSGKLSGDGDVFARQTALEARGAKSKGPNLSALLSRDTKAQLLILKDFLNAQSSSSKIIEQMSDKEVNFLRESAQRLLSHVELQQERAVQRSNDGEYFQVFSHWVAVKEKNHPLKLKVYYPKKKSGSDQSSYHRVALLLDMDRLGPVRVDLAAIGSRLHIDFYVTNDAAVQAVAANKHQVEQRLTGLFDQLMVNVRLSEEKINRFDYEDRSGEPVGRIDIKA